MHAHRPRWPNARNGLRASLSTAALSLSLLNIGGATAVADDGAHLLNRIGRFLGAGYSQQGYHAPQAYRGQQPAAYPSSRLTQIYLPANYAASPQPRPYGGGMIVIGAPPASEHQLPTPAPAPVPAPLVPPPTWLEPSLKDQAAEEQQGGSPARSEASSRDQLFVPPIRRAVPEVVQPKQENDLLDQAGSPYEDELLPEPSNRSLPRPANADAEPTSGENLLEEPADDLLLDGDDDLLINPLGDPDLLGADARYRLPAYTVPRYAVPRYAVPPAQTTDHRYTPFR